MQQLKNNRKQNVPIYIVNLKKDIEKKEYMYDLCQKYKLQVNFIEAIDGSLLDEKNILDVYSKEESLKEIGRELFLSEIGCALSHKYIYEEMLKNNIQEALILEDDIIFDSDLVKVLNHKKIFPDNWELILFGHHTYKDIDIDTNSSIWWTKNLINNYKLKRPSEIGEGTYGYLINMKGAKRLLNSLNVISKPIDCYTGDDKYINVYILVPSIIKIHDYMSGELHSMKERENAEFMKVDNRKIVKKILYQIGLIKCILFLRDNLKKMLPLKKYMEN